MGSLQQVVLGGICLVAAFIFGSYVNNHPFQPLTSPSKTATDGFASQVGTDAGNVESRIASGELDQLIKRAAPINTMRTPLKSALGGSEGNGSISKLLPRRSPLDDPLPPPSELASKNETTSQGDDKPTQQIQRRVVQHDLVPDFTEIANEFKNTPIELPKLGRKNQSQMTSLPNSGSGVVVNPANNLKSLASQFRANSSLKDNSLVDRKLDEPVKIQPRQPANEAWFKAEDFVPKLLGQGTRIPPVQPGTVSESASLIKKMEAPTGSQAGASPPPPAWEKQPEKIVSNGSNLDSNDRSIAPSPDQRTNRAHSVLAEATSAKWEFADPPTPMKSKQLVQPQTTESQSTFAGTYSPAKKPQVQTSAPRGNRVRTLFPSIIEQDYSSSRNAMVESATIARLGNTDESRKNPSPDEPKFREHLVKQGESLQSISETYFGRPDFYVDIYIANRSQMRNPIDIREGMSIKVPVFD